MHLQLTSLEQALLYLLASNPGRILSREQILDSIWGRPTAPRATSLTGTCGTSG
jgi:DNA-binding response OmpR family regulator